MKYSTISESFLSHSGREDFQNLGNKGEIPKTGAQRFSKALGGISDVSVTETGTYLQKNSSISFFER